MLKLRWISVLVLLSWCSISAFSQDFVNCYPPPGMPEHELITLINNWRVSRGLFPIAPDSRLAEAAQLHAQDMATTGFCGHIGSNGSTFGERIFSEGYSAPSGELIGCGYSSAASLMDAWLASSAHKEMLMGNHRHLGIGMVNNYWVVDLGASSDGPICANTNVAPVLSPIGAIEVTEGHLKALTITANDANGDALTYTAIGLPAFASFLDNGNGSATLTLTPPLYATGTYFNITIAVTDGQLMDSEAISITVCANLSPVISPIGNLILMDGVVYPITVSAIDANGDELSLIASGLPSFAAFYDNGNGTGLLTLSPPLGTTGIYNDISITASDGMLEDAIHFSITVTRLCFPAPETPELQLVNLINTWRGGSGQIPLATDTRLRDAAQLHAQDMATNGFCGHVGSNGSTFGERIFSEGYSAPSGELIGCGYSSAASLMDAWLASSAHKEMLRGNHRHLGVVMVDNYWVVDLGNSPEGPSCSGMSNLPPIANAGQDQSGHIGLSFDLDGSGSDDPDGGYPIEYNWTVLLAPPGSLATVLNPTSSQPSFIPDIEGMYTIQLIVTDIFGLSSEPDTLLVSTANAPPVSEAGPDQVIYAVDTVVQLDGSSSYDLDGDTITFQWTLLTTPAGSSASLSDSTAVTPSFKADVYGDYEIQLIVRDTWTVSNADIVMVTFNNVAPVAVAGGNHAVPVGTSVVLDGSESYDANLDSLTFRWSLISRPVGSVAMLTQEDSAQTSFGADHPGNYIVSLVVNDGLIDSPACTVTITAIVSESQVVNVLMQLIVVINELPEESVQNRNMKKTLTNKISAVLRLIDEGQYREALDKLKNDILQKADGCFSENCPDKNDWIIDCFAQSQVYPLIMEAIQYLGDLL